MSVFSKSSYCSINLGVSASLRSMKRGRRGRGQKERGEDEEEERKGVAERKRRRLKDRGGEVRGE